MRTATITFNHPDGTKAVAVHKTEFPGAEAVPEWSGNTEPLPSALLTQARTQDGLAARCYAIAREMGSITDVTVEIDGGYTYAD